MNACDTDMANGYTGWNTCVTVRFTRARAPVATTRDGENANRAPRAVRLVPFFFEFDEKDPFVGAATSEMSTEWRRDWHTHRRNRTAEPGFVPPNLVKERVPCAPLGRPL